MDAPQWSQQVACLTRPMEEITSTTPPPPPHNNNNNNLTNSSRGGANATTQQEASIERRSRPQKDQNINCPRCNSTNTKFCYYNNYSLTQPRFFCKTCRRYWTQGGSLRNVPVGGGSRKNKRSSYSTITSAPPPQLSSSTITPPPSAPPSHNKLLIPDLNPPTSLSHLLTSSQNPNFTKFLEGQDLNLAFPMQGLFHHHQFPKIDGSHTKIENYEPPININGNISTNKNNSGSATTAATTTTTTTTTSSPLSALELLRSGIASRGSMNPFIHPMSMPDSNTLYHQPGYPNMQEFKPSMMNMFSSPNDHEHNNNNNMIGLNDDHHEDNDNTNARLLFPFADMNKLASNTQQHDHQIDDHDQSKGGGGNDHHQHNHHAGYWSGMLGGGTW